MTAARRFLAAMFAISLLAAQQASAQEAVLEEMVVEGTFDLRMSSASESAVHIMTERLRLHAETSGHWS